MITKNYIITEKGRKNCMTDQSIAREVNHIVCASEYDYYGQVHIYSSAYFKGNCLVGVSISADNESTIDDFVAQYVKYGYLMED